MKIYQQLMSLVKAMTVLRRRSRAACRRRARAAAARAAEHPGEPWPAAGGFRAASCDYMQICILQVRFLCCMPLLPLLLACHCKLLAKRVPALGASQVAATMGSRSWLCVSASAKRRRRATVLAVAKIHRFSSANKVQNALHARVICFAGAAAWSGAADSAGAAAAA